MYPFIKRVLDIIISVIGLTITMPVMLLTCLAIKLESDGPVIFKQERLGQNGRIFKIWKFRSMVVDAEKGGVYTQKGDPRVTRVGKFIRATSIDELPQFINILKGDIKLVGVRPLSETFFKTYPEDLKKERVKYKPGLIPPYYADMTNNIQEVWASERRYLKRYQKKPFRTDLIYLGKALNNILFHNSQSS